MYNLRYHIASLVAVFLALSVGLLLGTVVVERGVLSSQKQTLVAGLTKDFDALRTENAGLTAQVSSLQSFATEVSPLAVSGVLADRTIVLVSSPGSADALDSAVTAIKAAGGSPVVASFGASGLGLAQPSTRGAAAKALGVPTTSDVATAVVQALAREWTTADDPRVVTRALANSGAVDIQTLPATATADAVVVLSSYDSKVDPAAIALGKAFVVLGRVAVAAEASTRRFGISEFASSAGISAVDDIDQPLGRCSLTWVLARRAKGWFGTSKGAVGPYPSPLYPAP